MSIKKDRSELEDLANRFRIDNGLSDTESILFTNLLRNTNTLTLFRPLDECSGMSIKKDINGRPERYMLINSSHPIGRQNFTICHELYHLFFQENFKISTQNAGIFDKNGDPEEYNADVFASYLLIPTAGLKKRIPEKEFSKDKITLKTLLDIEQYYQCSHYALLHRLRMMGLLTSNRLEELKPNIIKIALSLGYSQKLYEKGNENEVIGDYIGLVEEAWDGGIIQESVYLTFLSELGIDTTLLNDECGDEW